MNLSVSSAILKLTLIALTGFYLYRKRFIDERVLGFLSFFVVNVSMPFLIFSRLIVNFKPGTKPTLPVFILSSVIIFSIGLILGRIFSFKRRGKHGNEFVSLVSFQNSGYLPMSMVFVLFSPVVREQFLVYIFLYLFGYDLLMWSAGSFLIFRRKGESFNYRTILTAPIISITLSMILIYCGLAKYIPDIIISPLGMVGDTSFVFATIILGCWLAKISGEKLRSHFFPALEASLVKLLIVPLLVFAGLVKFKIFSLFGVFLMLEASMPSAVSLPIVSGIWKADSEFISQGVFVTHVLSIFTVSFWLSLYLNVSGIVF